jgi:DNA-binding transcriptional ArsR family regulator
MPLGLAFKALADKTRREILRLLRERDLTAGEIADRFEHTKPTISHHLNVLKQADLVQDVRRGQNIVYSLNTTVFQEAAAWFIAVLNGKEKETTVNKLENGEQGGTNR